jgi:hypothetical protein
MYLKSKLSLVNRTGGSIVFLKGEKNCIVVIQRKAIYAFFKKIVIFFIDFFLTKIKRYSLIQIDKLHRIQ